MNLPLDACASLWLAAEPRRLSKPARAALDDASNLLFLSDVTVWETVLKNQAGKLRMPEAPRTWLPKQAAFFHLQRQAIDFEFIFRSGELPPIHSTGCSAPQAITHHLTVLTPDRPYQDLGATTLW